MFVVGVLVFAVLGSVVIAIWAAVMGEKIKGVSNVSHVLILHFVLHTRRIFAFVRVKNYPARYAATLASPPGASQYVTRSTRHSPNYSDELTV